MSNHRYSNDPSFNADLAAGLVILEISTKDWNAASEEGRKDLIKKPYRKAQIKYHPDKTIHLEATEKEDFDKKNKLLAGLFGNAALDDTVKYDVPPPGGIPRPMQYDPFSHHTSGFNHGFGGDPFGRSYGFNGFNRGFGGDPFGRSYGFNRGFGADPFEEFFREQDRRNYNPAPPLNQLEQEFFEAIGNRNFIRASLLFKQAKKSYSREVPSTWFERLVVLPLEQQQLLLRQISPFDPKASMLLFAADYDANLLELLRVVQRHAPGNLIPAELLNAEHTQSIYSNLSLLKIACRRGDLPLFNFLIEANVRIDSREGGLSALLYASGGNKPEHLQMVDRLLEKGAILRPREFANMIAGATKIMQVKLVSHVMKMTPDEQRELLIALPQYSVRRKISYDNILVYGLIYGREHWLEGVYSTPPKHVQEVLDKTNFEHHFKLIRDKWHELDQRAQRYPTSNNRRGAAEAAELVQSLAKAKIELYKEPNAVKGTALFKKMCLDAAEKAKPELSKHRDWPKLIAGLVLALVTLPVSLPLYAVGMFSLKTNSAQKIDALEKDMKKDVKSDFKPQ